MAPEINLSASARIALSSCLSGMTPETKREKRDVEVLTDSRTISPVVCVREKTFVVSDEYRLQPGQPPLGEIVWHGVDIVPGSVRAVGSKIVFGGTVRMAVLYEAAETGELASASFETEFSQMLDTEQSMKFIRNIFLHIFRKWLYWSIIYFAVFHVINL